MSHSKHDRVAVLRTAKPLSFCLLAVGSLLIFGASSLFLGQAALAQVVRPSEAEFRVAKERVTAAPKDFKAHFDLAELWKRNGNLKDAAREYALATELNPSYYVAYHQMALSNPDAQTVEQAIERLNKLKIEKPKELLLRVALSELLEQRKEYYHAARTLVDLIYQNAVPELHLNKVNARIRLLLGKAREAQTVEKARNEEDDMELVPPPLPEASLRRNLHASKIKEPKVMPGVGHAPLLP